MNREETGAAASEDDWLPRRIDLLGLAPRTITTASCCSRDA